MAFFNSGIFYNSGSFYLGATSTATQGIPIDLRFYRTSQDSVYTFWWGFAPAFITPSLVSAGFDLELDVALPFTVTAVPDNTHLVVSSTTGMASGQEIFQGVPIPIAATGTATIVDYTMLTGAILTINGIPLTEGVDWHRGSSNNSAAVSLASAITTATTKTLSTGSATGAIVTITANIAGTNGNNITLATSDAVNLAIFGITLFGGSNFITITSVDDGTHLTVTNTLKWVTGLASAVTFNTPNLALFTQLLSSGTITYQNGNVRKGFTVPVATRIDGIEQVWYARVRTHTPSFISDWSTTLTWTIPQKVEQQYAEKLMTSLPDAHVYGKGDLLKLPNQRNSNLYVIEDMYGNQLDKVFYENFLTQTDNYVDMCRDEFLQQNYGVLFNFPKPNTMQFVDYRWILMNLFLASLVGSTNEAIILTVSSFTGVPPAITNIRDLEDFFLVTIQDPSVIAFVGIPIQTSYPFIDSTFVLEDLTTGLLVSSSDYTTDGIQGTWTLTNAGLTGHTFQAMFDIGNPNDPFPIVFDALEGATLLTGLDTLPSHVTFTNGSNNIAGTNSQFLSQLSVGDQITDPIGIYIGTIDQITDDFTVHLLETWKGPTEVNSAYRLLYSDLETEIPILWAQSSLKAGVLITVFNPGQFILS